MSQPAPKPPTAAAPMELPRSLLQVVRAPSTVATTVTLIAPLGGDSKLTLAYMPDRDILTRESFAAYAAAQAARPQLPESLAAVIAGDIANELVPRWHRVSIMTVTDRITHHVEVEDRQPGLDRSPHPAKD